MQQRFVINKMQRAVSLTRTHGGNVTIFKDSILSRMSYDIPSKSSFSGVHALKLFKESLDQPTRKLYVDVVNTKNNLAWKGLDKRDWF